MSFEYYQRLVAGGEFGAARFVWKTTCPLLSNHKQVAVVLRIDFSIVTK